LYGSAANVLTALAKDATATRYISNTGTSNNPAWAQVNLANGVTGDLPFANLTQGSALSVLGVTGNAIADVASIAAATDNQVLRRSGTALAFGAVNLASTDAVTGDLPFANVAQIITASLLGRNTAATGDIEVLTTIPTAVQDNITRLGTIVAGVWTGTDVAVADGGTGLSTATAYAVLCGGTTATGAFQSIASVGTAGQFLISNGAGALPTFQTSSAGAHTILDGVTHSDSVAQTVSRGSLIYGNITPKWDELVIGTANKILWSDGTDVSWTATPVIGTSEIGRAFV
jgi:hypothetical protein